jgi:hypothetical protein
MTCYEIGALVIIVVDAVALIVVAPVVFDWGKK